MVLVGVSQQHTTEINLAKLLDTIWYLKLKTNLMAANKTYKLHSYTLLHWQTIRWHPTFEFSSHWIIGYIWIYSRKYTGKSFTDRTKVKENNISITFVGQACSRSEKLKDIIHPNNVKFDWYVYFTFTDYIHPRDTMYLLIHQSQS